jgi:hypothetical protein
MGNGPNFGFVPLADRVMLVAIKGQCQKPGVDDDTLELALSTHRRNAMCKQDFLLMGVEQRWRSSTFSVP